MIETLKNDYENELTRTFEVDIEFFEYDALKEVRVLTVDENYTIIEKKRGWTK